MAKCRVCKKAKEIIARGFCADCLEMAKVMEANTEWVVKPKQFRNKHSGEVATQISFLELNDWEEIDA